MAQTFGGDSGDDLISGINVTPLVDVILVLLIIFMITAPVIYQSAIKIQLPKAATGEASDKAPLAFSLTKEGRLSWGNEEIDWDTLRARLKKSPPAVEETAMINADTATPHGTVVRLMDELKQAGLGRFALNVEQVSPKN